MKTYQALRDGSLELGDDQFSVSISAECADNIAHYGPRFDTLGYVRSVRLKGHSFLCCEGLIDEFNIFDHLPPPGYRRASIGETFVKIGVGELIRPDARNYIFSRSYTIYKQWPVEIDAATDGITFRQ